MQTYHTKISSTQSWFHVPWREIAEYKDLLFLMVKRDLTAIYKQTVLGPLWFVIQPVVTALVFTVIFGNVARVSTDGVPHFIFYMSGTVLWGYFQGVLNHSASSLIANTTILSKVYFPRIVIPLSGVIVNLCQLALNMLLFLGFYIWFLVRGNEMEPNAVMFMLPLLVLQCGLMGLGFGLLVSGLTVKYRDLRFALPLIVQLWMYATPIVYPASLVSKPILKVALWLNPMTAVVEFCRYGFTGSGTADLTGLMVSWTITLLVLASGLLFFNRIQRTFVDTI